MLLVPHDVNVPEGLQPYIAAIMALGPVVVSVLMSTDKSLSVLVRIKRNWRKLVGSPRKRTRK